MFNQLINKITYLLLPQFCISCKKFGEIICDKCLEKLGREKNPYGAISFYPYADPIVKKAIWLLKYRGVYSLAQKLSQAIYPELMEELSDALALINLDKNEKILIVPTPISRERLRERDYNQSEIIAKEVVKLDHGKNFELAFDVLEKIKNTPSQVSIKDRSKRLKNLRGAFKLRGKIKIKDRIVILVDDVITTGGTMEECTRILRHGHPRKIIKLALAH